MTSPDSHQVRSPPSKDESVPPPREHKSVLFCPACSHRDLVDGDWVERDDSTAGVRELRCPECATTLTSRPLPEDSAATGGNDGSELWDHVETVSTLWMSTVRFWVEAVDPVQRRQRAN